MSYSKFQKLDRDREQIRLLHLKPAELHEPISATLSLAYLDEQPSYEALSYVWGDGEDPLEITLDGETFPVKINLFAALRLRDRHEIKVLWVDALCINQEDDAEKSYQVRLMTEIFRNSRRCFAWLGEFEEDVVLKQGVTLDAYRGEGVTMDKENARLALDLVTKLSELSTDGHFTADEACVPAGWVSVSPREVTALNKLMSLKFFDRIWTVQEFILPSHVGMVLGTIRCEEALERLVSMDERDLWKHDPVYGGCCKAAIEKVPDLPALILDLYENTVTLRHMRKRQLTVHQALEHFRTRNVKDPRDKIFGLLGLTDPSTRQLIDYKLSKKRVYIGSVRYGLRTTNSLRPLMRLPESNHDTALPSWVPSHEVDAPDTHTRNMMKMEAKYLYQGPLLFSTGTQRDMELGSAGAEDELRLGGRRFDTVRRVFEKPPQSLWQSQGGSVLRRRLREEWLDLLASDPRLDFGSYPSGGSYTTALYRTFTSDTLVPMDRKITRITADDEEIVTGGLSEQGYAAHSGLLPTKTFFVTERGYIGIGPDTTEAGDAVYVLFGGHLPFLLRDIPEGLEGRGSHTYVGHAYVHGIMDGEVLLMDDIQDEEVNIV
ncbi:hypothetical protein KVR01_004018 [Diaporthe batatas]|uniref:uncharacterized protein n=1 Tax=Diaporthe batatas TaxID=748121 RepID=UPI001D041CA0|nr:uncharacterized protein KVR01_004018 [Diaporthe batatas]KAG8165466.1 hypothetical protein KVR01_004018 [Diaporthe batatas]